MIVLKIHLQGHATTKSYVKCMGNITSSTQKKTQDAYVHNARTLTSMRARWQTLPYEHLHWKNNTIKS